MQINEDISSEPYIALIKRLVINKKLDFDTAKILISEYKKIKMEGK
ncbi:SHOCT-like domain-containing protein [Natronincola ferrireducens]